MESQIKVIVKKAKSAFLRAKNDNELIPAGIKECSNAFHVLRNSYLKKTRKVGEKHQITHAMSLVQGYMTQLKQRGDSTSIHIKWEDLETAFVGRIRTGAIINLSHKDPINFLKDCKETFQQKMAHIMTQQLFVKVNTVLFGNFLKFSAVAEIEDVKNLNTKNEVITRDTNLSEWFEENVTNKMLKKLDDFHEKDSGWSLKEIINLTININKYSPMVGSSYIKLPPFIIKKKACVNVKNKDNACFAWAIVSALYPVDTNPHRVTKYPHYSTVLNFSGIKFPIRRPDIQKFENLNKISINVYELCKEKKAVDTYKVLPTRLTKNKLEKHVNLLLLQNVYNENAEEEEFLNEAVEAEQAIRFHYVWIKHISRLLSSQMSACQRAKYLCDRCLHYFYTAEKLQAHVSNCGQHNDYKVTFPTKNRVQFTNYKKQELAPFILYADFECILKPTSVKKGNGEHYLEHEAHSVGYFLKCSYNNSLSHYESYRGLSCAAWFAKELHNIANTLKSDFEHIIPMKTLTLEQEQSFICATNCHICEKQFTKFDMKVKDHCHFTGKYRGPAHQVCNINYKHSYTIPIVIHNLSRYDAHLLIKDISNSIPGQLKIIPNNTENYIAFIKYIDDCIIGFKFIDSFRFMASSLDILVSYLNDKTIIDSQFPDIGNEKLKLLKRKGVFPYEYISNWSVLEESQLPTKEQFYSSLGKCHITTQDYEHAQEVWLKFDIKTLGEYSDLYLKTDVLLLADVFENFRACCIDNYKLDPAHYYTAPGLAWDAMLKHTSAIIELVQDVDMLMFIENGIRGGLTQVSKRYAKANNKYMPDYDSNQASTYLMYYDINAMYSWAMTQYLPYGNLQWVEDIDNLNYNIPADSDFGYILEVDIEYPTNIHNKHKELPMAPEKRAPPGFKDRKLLATLYNKSKYILHYRNLKQYLNEGLKVTKIHRALKFSQTDWMKPYIDLNTSLRKNAKNEFEKNLFKLMCNAVFGKTMENVRLRRDIKLVKRWEGRYGAEALISKPNFHSLTIFEENLAAIELLKTEIIVDKPIYIGMAILDISKTLLYQFHYNYMKYKYGDNCELCYTDTDSLIYEIKANDIYMDMSQNLNQFDTSGYSANNPFNLKQVNKKELGLMKDENNGQIMLELVALRAKMYALRVLRDDAKQGITKKAKGVKSAVINREITFEDYKNCLMANLEYSHIQNTIKSEKHVLYNTSQRKITLSPFDNKRYIMPGSFLTLPWGHYDVVPSENENANAFLVP